MVDINLAGLAVVHKNNHKLTNSESVRLGSARRPSTSVALPLPFTDPAGAAGRVWVVPKCAREKWQKLSELHGIVPRTAGALLLPLPLPLAAAPVADPVTGAWKRTLLSRPWLRAVS